MWVLFLAVPLGLVALAVALDRRSQRGYGLGLLAMVTIVLDICGIISVSQAEQSAFASHTDNLDFALVEAAYFLIGLYITLVLVLGGIVESVISRQWRWLALIATLSVIPAVLILAPGTALVPDLLRKLGLSRDDEAVILLLLPVLVTFAYGIVRIVHPPTSHPSHQFQDPAA